MAAPELVLLGIKGSLKIGTQIRAAYVDATRGRALVLPLPDFDPEPDKNIARTYFKRRADVIFEPTELVSLVQKIKQGATLSDAENDSLLIYYREHQFIDYVLNGNEVRVTTDGAVFSGDGLTEVLRIRQWQRGAEPHPSTLQRLAGTFLELGIDYFSTVPGALNLQSREGKALHAFLSGFDQIEFAEVPLGNLPEQLFFATLETVSENADLLTEDPNIQELISVTTTGLVTDVRSKIEEIRRVGPDAEKEQQVTRWAEVVFRSVLSSAGGLVVADPRKFLGIEQAGQSALVSAVGSAMLDIVLSQPAGQLERAFSKQGLDSLVKAALTAVARHPELVAGDETRLHKLIGEVASQMSQLDSVLGSSILPELGRIVIERMADNLELLWPDGATDPGKNLVLVAARTVLTEMSRKPGDGDPWSLAFTRENLLTVVEAVADEIAEAPGWILNAAGEVDVHLEAAVQSMIAVLRSRGDARLNSDLAVELVGAGIRGAALRAEFLDRIADQRPLVAVLLDHILSVVLDQGLNRKAAWRLVKSDVLLGLMEIATDQLSGVEVNEQNVAVVKALLEQHVIAIDQGQPWSLERFEVELEQALSP